jgi:hypothetical protein
MIIKFKQNSLAEAKLKMKKLVGNTSHGTIGFCNFQIAEDFSEYLTDKEIENNPPCIDYYLHNKLFSYCILASSSYHFEASIIKMYETDGKSW